jgi:hypothetical protein
MPGKSNTGGGEESDSLKAALEIKGRQLNKLRSLLLAKLI